ncbi:MAG: ABC transporter transmembrane domain-containing protein [Candidatus Brocadiia bacterium]
MWREPLPQGVRLNESVRLSAEADLLPDGSFGKELLVVTDRAVRVYPLDGSAPRPRLELPLEEVAEPRAEQFVGGGALEVTRGGERLELVRYTAARIPRFATAAKLLGKWARGEEAELPEDQGLVCPNCGLPLEKGTRVCPTCTPKRRTIVRLLAYLRPCWKAAAALTLLALATTAFGLVPPYLQKPLMDEVLAPPPETAGTAAERMSLLAYLVLAWLGVQVFMAGVGICQRWLSSWLGNRITHNIRSQLYRHLQYLSLGFYDKREMGAMISRVNHDTGSLQRFLVWGSQELVRNLMLIAGIGAMLVWLDWRLALFVFAPAPVVALLSGAFWKHIRFLMHRVWHRWGRLNALLSESLSGLKVVKVFAQEPRTISGFDARSEDLARMGVQAERMWAVLFSGLQLVIRLGTLLVWYFGGRFVLQGEMSLGVLVAVTAYLWMFYGPIQSLSQLVNWCSRSLTAAERVFEILDVRPEVSEDQEAVPMPRIEGHVEFRDVTFGYEAHHPVLKAIDLEAQPGEMIGLVGHSGAGKTTTINLLCRFYDPDEGEILVDGVPLRKIRLADLRRQLGVVPQDTFLFSGTIAENVAYAKTEASREEIVRAAKVANAHDFILRKPDGYETHLGEKGAGLSAGERQRLAIARAVLHNPRILILDEATSQLDVETEKQVQEAIARLVQGRTTFAIAHRLATLRNADRLVVLKNGEIVETGTHDELMAREGEFQRLVQTYQEISKVRAVER